MNAKHRARGSSFAKCKLIWLLRLEGSGARSESRPGPTDKLFSGLHFLLQSTVLAAFAEDWNATRRDPLIALPPELVSDIFRRLDFSGRLAASHTCRSWRKAALSDLVLWAEYAICMDVSDPEDINPPSPAILAAKGRTLSALLERSSPIPFRLDCLVHVSDTLAEIVIANLSRLEFLRLGPFQSWATFKRLLALDAPLLKTFEYPLETIHPPLPMSAGWTLRLESLDIHQPWVWPAGYISRSLRTLKGLLPEVVHGDGKMANLFPNLRVLEPTHLSDAEVDRLRPLPCHLTSLTLPPAGSMVDYSISKVDYSRILSDRRGPVLHQLDIIYPTASFFREAIELFFRAVRGQWALRCENRDKVFSSIQTDEPYQYRIQNAGEDNWLHPPVLLSSWSRLRALDLTLDNWCQIRRTLSTGTTLPSLLTVTTHGIVDYFWMSVRAVEDAALLEAPALSSMSLVTARDSGETFALILLIIRGFHAPTLRSVDVEMASNSFVPPEDFKMFAGFAGRVTFEVKSPEADVPSRTYDYWFDPPKEHDV
ncbi:hypothetical protein AURDEDRAFT_168079 [Auricularia subglabra TFB-10046 SS5]|nr:hypothetical protein AURDEDRAFT_168079 [Auricularia subglabra TFB-10046 SS5]